MTLKCICSIPDGAFCLTAKFRSLLSAAGDIRNFYNRYSRSFVIVGLAVTLQSCASYGLHATSMRDGLLSGHPELSLAIAEKKDPDGTEVISSLDKGMLRRINGDYSGSNQVFEVAKREIEKLYGISVTENLASVTINETMRSYVGERYEQLLLHAFMAMNYIQLEDMDAARVEMLQANVKMMEWGEQPDEDAFLRYLEGIIYENLGEYDNALISYRKAYIVYKEQGGEKYPSLPAILKKDLLRLTKREGLDSEFQSFKKEFNLQDYQPVGLDDSHGELVVIINNGLAPIKSEAVIPVFSTEIQKNLQIAFPVYRQRQSPLSEPDIRIGEQLYSMETVEDVDRLARYYLDKAMPGIMSRATARAVVKYNTQHTAESNSSFAGLLMTMTNLITERADTRSWSTLPQAIQLQRILLPVGEHQIMIQMRGTAGQVVDTLEQTVVINPGRSSFIIRHWTAPLLNRQSAASDNKNSVS